MARSKTGAIFLSTVNKPATSLSPDDLKNYSTDKVNEFGLQAMTRARGGTGQRAPMPKARRQLFTQSYWKASRPVADYTLGDQFGVTTRKEETAGSQTGGI